MKVAWVADKHDPPGGAELTQEEFREAAPVEVVDWPEPADVTVVHNCQTYPDYPDGKVVRYLHDCRGKFKPTDKLIFCSPAQREFYELEGKLIPPPVDLRSFRPTRQQKRNPKRNGTCCIGAYMNPGKGGYKVEEWAEANEPVDFYGWGPYRPQGPCVRECGPLDQRLVATALSRYERFVFLPTVLEPFGRCVVEAWAAGLEVITNELVGAKWWLEQRPERIESAAQDFWDVVLSST